MKITAILVTAVMIFLGIYDAIVVSFYGGVDASISRFLQETMFASPVFSFGLGAIFGHVALYMRPKWKNVEDILTIVKNLDTLEEIVKFTEIFYPKNATLTELRELIKQLRKYK